MKNALTLTVGLLAAVAMTACQKNADKLGTSVRGRSTTSAITTSAVSGANGNVTVTNSNEVYQLASHELNGTALGTIQAMNIAIHMCRSVTGAAQTVGSTPLSASSASIELDISDTYAQQYGPIVTKLPFQQGYIQPAGNGYTYIAAEFGDGVGNVAFDGYYDTNGNLIQGRVFNDIFGVDAGLIQVGTFQISGSGWTSACQ